MHRRVALEDAELFDLLDRILDKGVFLGSANLLLLGQANLSEPDTHITVTSIQTNTDSYAVSARRFARIP